MLNNDKLDEYFSSLFKEEEEEMRKFEARSKLIAVIEKERVASPLNLSISLV